VTITPSHNKPDALQGVSGFFVHDSLPDRLVAGDGIWGTEEWLFLVSVIHARVLNWTSNLSIIAAGGTKSSLSSKRCCKHAARFANVEQTASADFFC